MINERHNKLIYCNICKNKQKDKYYVALCGLTGKFANFETECADYKFSKEEYLYLVEQSHIRTKKNNDFQLEQNKKWKLDKEDEEYIEIELTKIKTPTSKIELPDFIEFKRTLFGQILVSVFFFGIIIFVNIKSFSNQSDYKILFIIFSIFISFGLFAILYNYYFKAINKIIVDRNGIEFGSKIDKNNYKWSEILNIKIITIHSYTNAGKQISRRLLIEFISGFQKEFSTEDLFIRNRHFDFIFSTKEYFDLFWNKILENSNSD